MRAFLRQLPAGARDRLWRLAGGRYVIDEAYCGRFGHNVTGNPNGYLRCVDPTHSSRL